MSKQVNYEGELDLNGFKIPCYVLDDGTRVISGNQMQESLKLFSADTKIKSGSRLARLLGYESIKPLITKAYEPGHFDPVICYNGNQKINGYEATVLADICEIMLDARRMGLLTGERQKQIANQAEILIRSFARVGIIALVDEATGYQEVRQRDALQVILDKYLRKEYAAWAKRFPLDFYEELFRLKGWQLDKRTMKMPGVVGRYTNDIVYNRLAPGILEELQKKNPVQDNGRRATKHHQWLTEETGHPALDRHFSGVMALMRANSNWENFKRGLERAYPKIGSQLALKLYEDAE